MPALEGRWNTCSTPWRDATRCKNNSLRKLLHRLSNHTIEPYVFSHSLSLSFSSAHADFIKIHAILWHDKTKRKKRESRVTERRGKKREWSWKRPSMREREHGWEKREFELGRNSVESREREREREKEGEGEVGEKEFQTTQPCNHIQIRDVRIHAVEGKILSLQQLQRVRGCVHGPRWKASAPRFQRDFVGLFSMPCRRSEARNGGKFRSAISNRARWYNEPGGRGDTLRIDGLCNSGGISRMEIAPTDFRKIGKFLIFFLFNIYTLYILY